MLLRFHLIQQYVIGMLVPDEPYSYTIQMKRSEFINDKLFDSHRKSWSTTQKASRTQVEINIHLGRGDVLLQSVIRAEVSAISCELKQHSCFYCASPALTTKSFVDYNNVTVTAIRNFHSSPHATWFASAKINVDRSNFAFSDLFFCLQNLL